MLEKLKPDLIVPNLQAIPIEKLKMRGIEGLIIDLDNTLTFWNCPIINENEIQWLEGLLENGFKICVVSNNYNPQIASLLKTMKISFIPNAGKPAKIPFLKAMKQLETTSQTTAVIGDQLFTDILGGKRVQATTILVTPLSKREFFGTRAMRYLEKMILK